MASLEAIPTNRSAAAILSWIPKFILSWPDLFFIRITLMSVE
jgi:hypothetical protein